MRLIWYVFLNQPAYVLSGCRTFPARGIKSQQDEEQKREAPQRGAAIAEEGERYADHRAQSDHHTDVDAEVEAEI